MRKILLLLSVCFFALGSVAVGQQKSANKADATKGWAAFTETFLANLFKEYPEYAGDAGSHQYDHVLLIPDEATRKQHAAYLAAAEASLKNYPKNALSQSEKADLAILSNRIEQMKFNQSELKAWVWNPAQYNDCGSFSKILVNTQVPLKQRLESLLARIKQVPAYYQAAAQNVKRPSATYTKLALAQNKGGMRVFDELLDSLKKTSPKPDAFLTAQTDVEAAKAAVNGYLSFLEAIPASELTSFRLDSAIYVKKFDLAIQTGQSAQSIYRAALARKRYLHGKMFALATQLAPKYLSEAERSEASHDSLALIKAVIDKISKSHCKPEEFQDKIQAQIPTLAEFVKAKDLLYQDPSKPLVVRKEPDYMAGVAGASISAPGPLEKGGNTYYNVGSLAAMSAAEKESFLCEYNDYTLQILNIHEAIPGHYTQLVYSNRSPSLVKSMFGNGAFREGWAVFGELMMLENGYGNNSPELWLMYYKWNLRTVCNTILDYSIHVKNMPEEQGLDLLLRQAFQTEAEAKGKWNRATLSSVQLCSYFSGFDAIVKLRDAHKELSVKAFNEKILSYGSAPLYLIAEAMLQSK
jgi:uncharacterized protein (DUF885 family)